MWTWLFTRALTSQPAGVFTNIGHQEPTTIVRDYEEVKRNPEYEKAKEFKHFKLEASDSILKTQKRLKYWAQNCNVGDYCEFPPDLTPSRQATLLQLAQGELPLRNEKMVKEQKKKKVEARWIHRLWMMREDNGIVAKMWIGPLPRAYRKREERSKFSASEDVRIQTMWSPEYGWCRWSAIAKDYVPDPSLNKEQGDDLITEEYQKPLRAMQ